MIIQICVTAVKKLRYYLIKLKSPEKMKSKYKEYLNPPIGRKLSCHDWFCALYPSEPLEDSMWIQISYNNSPELDSSQSSLESFELKFAALLIINTQSSNIPNHDLLQKKYFEIITRIQSTSRFFGRISSQPNGKQPFFFVPRIQLSFAEELFLQTGYSALAAKEFSNMGIYITSWTPVDGGLLDEFLQPSFLSIEMIDPKYYISIIYRIGSMGRVTGIFTYTSVH